MVDCKTSADIKSVARGEECVAYGVEITGGGPRRWMKGGDGLPWFGPESAALLYAEEKDAHFRPHLRYAVKAQVIVLGDVIED
jgi:hypothetical protein